jgi:vacuolar-type H+-ATPase subunit H
MKIPNNMTREEFLEKIKSASILIQDEINKARNYGRTNNKQRH